MSDPIMPPSSPLGYESTGMLTETDPGQRSQAMVAHLLGIIALIGPGIYYLIKKNDPTAGPFVRDQIKEVFNWGIVVVIAAIAINVITVILAFVSGTLAVIFSLLGMVVGIGNLVLVIMAAMKANSGVAARYPFTLKVLK